MVKHQPLQVYERQLCLSCLTGIYGCRWKRYQRSHDDTTKIGVTAALLTTVIGVISVSQIWSEEWDVVSISLQSTGPFLHIGALAAVTALAWLVAGQVARAEKTKFQVIVLLVYLVVLLSLYLAPLSITSPCIMERHNLKARPAVIGQRGAPMLAPENTLLSFQRALQKNVIGLEAEVAISLDGVPFLMRDPTLRRTTDVSKVFPKRQNVDASFFNWTELSMLNAGQWFLKRNPYWTVKYMSERERWLVGNQTICSLEQMLQLAARSNRSALFTVRRPPPGHPHNLNWVNVTLSTVLRSGVPQHLVVWSVDWDRELVQQQAPGFQQISTKIQTLENLHEKGISRLLLRYSRVSEEDIRMYTAANVSVTLYTVNEPWLYSVLWCSGVHSVSSEAPQILRKVLSPLWLMAPHEYCLIWVSTDLVSFALVLGIFIFQK
ncbi:Glycerophosphodiester phosphodiesterase domain-containing protein 5 [Bagarius yarrelli]|uniref:Glycerophosphodiester phosphodiesterase domain-containing protein 5 n=1 Tax=Bagarius yarrelli TaxID=175774 RepID=A0A556TRR8_BAGYA|nr:Glycerophosphodiester phosphodiesterase domain-containing protein 5 [Bagarius yarrelli]